VQAELPGPCEPGVLICLLLQHLECTEIGLKAGVSIDQSKAEAKQTAKKPAKKKPADPIEGLSRLTAADQKRVREYMTQNDNNGVIDERLDLTDDHFTKKGRMPEKQPSKHLTATLLPYQREALAWMVAQEASDYRGGILADEMGMGKTIQAISLLLENVREGGKTAKARKASGVRGGTLVVCPLVAVMQWKSEIERFVEPGHLSVYIHHGPKRLDSVDKIAAYDIVLTTYSIIESEIRKTLGWAKVACQYCGKKYLPDKLVSHNKYFCGPDARKTALQDRQEKKRPKQKRAAGESSDEEEDEDVARGGGSWGRRASKAKSAKSKPEEKKLSLQKTKGKSPLHQIEWTRIVLDEAHYIKDRNCNTARGVFALKSTYKWCLSGESDCGLQQNGVPAFNSTRLVLLHRHAAAEPHWRAVFPRPLPPAREVRVLPLQHVRLPDAGLQVRSPPCPQLVLHLTALWRACCSFPEKRCVQCSHSAIQHYSYFNKKVVIPIQAYGYVAEGKLAMQRLHNDVLQHVRTPLVCCTGGVRVLTCLTARFCFGERKKDARTTFRFRPSSCESAKTGWTSARTTSTRPSTRRAKRSSTRTCRRGRCSTTTPTSSTC